MQERELQAAAIVLVLAIGIAALLLSQQNAPLKKSPVNLSSPSQPKEMVNVGRFAASVAQDYWTNDKGNKVESALVKNEGDDLLEAGWTTILPSDDETDPNELVFSTKPPQAESYALLSQKPQPLIKYASLRLNPGEAVEKSIEFLRANRNPERSPVYFLTAPLSSSDQNLLLPSFRKIASLKANRAEAKAVQKKINAALNGTITPALADAVEKAVDDAKKDIDTRILNPDYDAAKAIEAEPVPTPSVVPTPTPVPWFEDLPTEISFTLSESDTSDSKTVSFKAPEQREVTVRVTGTVSKYVKPTPEFEFESGEYSASVKVDLEKAPRDADGKIKADSLEGVMKISVPSAEKSAELKIKVRIEHISKKEMDSLKQMNDELKADTLPDNGFVAGALRGNRIGVEGGHFYGNGCNPGACDGSICENQRNAVVAEELARLLGNAGVIVVKRIPTSQCSNSDPTLSEIGSYFRQQNVGAVVSVHHDSAGSGLELVYYPETSNKQESIQLANMINSQLAPIVSARSGGLWSETKSQDGKLWISDFKVPAVLVEVSRVDDPKYHTDPDFGKKAARAIFDGVAKYFGIGKINAIGTAERPITGCSVAVSSTPAALSECGKHEALLKTYMERNGLTAMGIDIGLVESLIMQESSCNHQINSQGLMQVLSCDPNGCSLEDNINRGTAELSSRLAESRSELGADYGKYALTLTLFGYNRGGGAKSRAIANMKSGMDAYDAMVESCRYYYPTYGGCSGHNIDQCCEGEGLGARYPEKILNYYKRACEDAGGTLNRG
ncbi:MAG: N-acetylmuramoyl-L-alanine amidase [Candidatus Micrarchaeota archaeon]